MKELKISVIIPVYNAEETLEQCLKSVLNQTYKNYEVIVVDNNSTDSTSQIIKGYQGKNPKIKYIFEKKKGRGAARNTGEKKAKGEIILMTDSDCIAPKNWIQEMIKPILNKKAVAVQGLKKPVIKNYWTINIKKERERINKEIIKTKKIGMLDTANFAITKSVLKKVGYTSRAPTYTNDVDLEIKLKLRNYDILLEEIFVKHYEPDSLIKIFKKLFYRGKKWHIEIEKRYRNNKDLFYDNTLNQHLNYFKSILIEILKMNKKAPYNLVTGIAWRLGLLYGKLMTKFKQET